jgi:hypothetical protein
MPSMPIVCFESAMGLCQYVSIKCLTIVQAIGGKFPRFLIFFSILAAGIYVTKKVKKSLQFVYIFACTIAWKNKSFLPNICLTKIQTFHRLSEAYCLCNRLEKYTFFGEHLFDKNSIFQQAC